MDEQIERFLNTCTRYAAMQDSERKRATLNFIIAQAGKLNTMRKDLMRSLEEQDCWLIENPNDKRRIKFDDYWIADLRRYEKIEKALADGATITFGSNDHAAAYERPYYRPARTAGADAG